MDEMVTIECAVKDGNEKQYLDWFVQESSALQPDSCACQDGLPGIVVGFKNRNTRQKTIGKFVKTFPDAKVDWR